MTIDEAIKHCLEVAEKNDGEAEVYGLLAKNHNNSYEKLTASRFHADCTECAADHRQLAAWLAELKEAKRLLKLAITCLNDGGCTKDCDVCINLKDCIRERRDNSFKWRYTDEVKGLIND